MLILPASNTTTRFRSGFVIELLQFHPKITLEMILEGQKIFWGKVGGGVGGACRQTSLAGVLHVAYLELEPPQFQNLRSATEP